MTEIAITSDRAATVPAPARPGPSDVELRPLRILAHAFRAADLAQPRRESTTAAPFARAPLAETASLFEVIRTLASCETVLVAGATGVVGQIRRKDVQRLPGRTWLFGLVAFIELNFTQRIDTRWTEAEWSALLSPGRLAKAQAVQAERARRNDDCRLLDCLQISDKAGLLIGDDAEFAKFRFESRKSAKHAVKRLELLRNHLAHSQEIVDLFWVEVVDLSARVEQSLKEAGYLPADK